MKGGRNMKDEMMQQSEELEGVIEHRQRRRHEAKKVEKEK